jgi:hypothetical protein
MEFRCNYLRASKSTIPVYIAGATQPSCTVCMDLTGTKLVLIVERKSALMDDRYFPFGIKPLAASSPAQVILATAS